MSCGGRLLLIAALAVTLSDSHAQTGQKTAPPPAGWQPGIDLRALPDTPTTGWTATVPAQGKTSVEKSGGAGAAPRSAPEVKQLPAGKAQVVLTALLTEDGQSIDQGLVWRIYRDRSGDKSSETRSTLVATHREAAPVVQLDPGDYLVNAAFGRANLTRKISLAAGKQSNEKFILNAGGLRVGALLASGESAPDKSVSYDIYSDERDQYGQRTKIIAGARPGLVIRLNAGFYHIVSTLGDANASVRADVTVEAGKLTDATVAHGAARVTFKLVTAPGGNALPDTQWSIATAQGDVIKESVGALPTHMVAPGAYAVQARHGGKTYRREFRVQAGDSAEIEVQMR